MIRRKARTKSKLKSRIVCKTCCKVFINESLKQCVPCPFCGKIIDARIRTEWAKEYSKTHPNRIESFKKYDKLHGKERRQRQRQTMRDTILNIISENDPKCVRCRCDDKRFLEINHKNGGGNKELQKGKHSNQFYWDIYSGKRKVDDLELLCKPCNAIHALELKYGKTTYRVVYK